MATSTPDRPGHPLGVPRTPPAPTPDRFLVHRTARAHPPPLPTGELLVAAPPMVSWPGPATAAWLQYLVPMLGGAGSLAFLFAVPGPRHPLLVVAVASQPLDEGRLRGLDGHLRYRICLRTFSAVESSDATHYIFMPGVGDNVAQLRISVEAGHRSAVHGVVPSAGPPMLRPESSDPARLAMADSSPSPNEPILAVRRRNI